MAGVVTPKEAAAQLRLAAKALNAATRKSIEEAGKVALPIMRAQAQQAAGGDRRLRNMANAGVLAADWKVTGRAGNYQARMSPRGPWRIRDNSYTGGKTHAHTIRARRVPYLIFTQRDGTLFRGPQVSHPGSARGPFWSDGVTAAIAVIGPTLPAEAVAAVAGAFGRPGSFKS